MFERFTDRARRVVVLAQEEAMLLDHNYIGTEHILLGLIHEGEGVAFKALEGLGISLGEVRREVEAVIGRGQSQRTGHIPFTPRAKKVLELSLREALQLGHNFIGTEHILLGLLREGEGVAAQVLRKMGADMERVRQQVVQLLAGYTAEMRESPAREPGAITKEWLQKAVDRARRARALAARLAASSGEPSLSADEILFGLLVTDDRLVSMEALADHLEGAEPRQPNEGSEESNEEVPRDEPGESETT